MFPILEIFDNNMPKYSKEVRASENDDDQLEHSVELHD
jgi:hypothetical protein